MLINVVSSEFNNKNVSLSYFEIPKKQRDYLQDKKQEERLGKEIGKKIVKRIIGNTKK